MVVTRTRKDNSEIIGAGSLNELAVLWSSVNSLVIP